ncbi:hypothetical protein EJB05_39689, partial [Eragrostis curvula]
MRRSARHVRKFTSDRSATVQAESNDPSIPVPCAALFLRSARPNDDLSPATEAYERTWNILSCCPHPFDSDVFEYMHGGQMGAAKKQRRRGTGAAAQGGSGDSAVGDGDGDGGRMRDAHARATAEDPNPRPSAPRNAAEPARLTRARFASPPPLALLRPQIAQPVQRPRSPLHRPPISLSAAAPTRSQRRRSHPLQAPIGYRSLRLKMQQPTGEAPSGSRSLEPERSRRVCAMENIRVGGVTQENAAAIGLREAKESSSVDSMKLCDAVPSEISMVLGQDADSSELKNQKEELCTNTMEVPHGKVRAAEQFEFQGASSIDMMTAVALHEHPADNHKHQKEESDAGSLEMTKEKKIAIADEGQESPRAAKTLAKGEDRQSSSGSARSNQVVSSLDMVVIRGLVTDRSISALGILVDDNKLLNVFSLDLGEIFMQSMLLELLRMAQVDAPLWNAPGMDGPGETLNEEYARMFRRGIGPKQYELKSEASLSYS